MIKNAFVLCAVLMASVAMAETTQIQRSNSGGSAMAATINVQKQSDKATQMADKADKDSEKAMLSMQQMEKGAKQKTVQLSNSGGSAMARSIQTK